MTQQDRARSDQVAPRLNQGLTAARREVIGLADTTDGLSIAIQSVVHFKLALLLDDVSQICGRERRGGEQ